MLAVAFDTLKLARSLESAGFAAKQAQDTSAAIAQSFTEWQSNINLATREDIQRLELATRDGLQKLELAARDSLQKLELDVRKIEANLEIRIADKAADTIKWVLGISVAEASLIIAILKLRA